MEHDQPVLAVLAVLAGGGAVGPDRQERAGAVLGTPAAAGLLLELDHPEMSLSLVIVEADAEVGGQAETACRGQPSRWDPAAPQRCPSQSSAVATPASRDQRTETVLQALRAPLHQQVLTAQQVGAERRHPVRTRSVRSVPTTGGWARSDPQPRHTRGMCTTVWSGSAASGSPASACPAALPTPPPDPRAQRSSRPARRAAPTAAPPTELQGPWTATNLTGYGSDRSGP